MTQVPPLKIGDATDFGRVGLVIGGSSAEREVRWTRWLGGGFHIALRTR